MGLLLLFSLGCAEPVPAPTATVTLAVTASITPELGVPFVTVAPPSPNIRQVTPTPLPTATPTPTATPVIYQLKAGDTLLAIAIDYGTTVGEIEALNPGIQPNLLQIGQAIVLPPRQDVSLAGIAPTPIPVQVAVRSVVLYQTPLGGAWLLGDVVNEGEFPAENLQVAITLRDQSNLPVATAAAWVYPTLLHPGERGGFALLLEQLPEAGGEPEASIVAGATASQLGNRYPDLYVDQIVPDLAAEEATLTGAIINGGDAAAVMIRLVAILYDEQDRVSGLVQWQANGPLAAGDTLPFTLPLAPPGGAPASYQINVEALRLEEE